MKRIFTMMQIAGAALAVAIAGGMDSNLIPILQAAVGLTGACALLFFGSLLQRERGGEE